MTGVKKATRILEKHFNKDTELYKEFRLFNAMAKSSVKNTEIAAAIMTEAKAASRRFDSQQLKKEKSLLIKAINYQIKDPKFYYRSVPNYIQYASIQNLLNEWQKGDRSDLRKLVEIEKKAIEWLLEEKHELDLSEEKRNLEASDSSRLVVKIMTEKINNKYGNLTNEQKEIIKNYALYGSKEEDHRKLTKFLRDRKLSAIKTVNEYSVVNENKYVSDKIKPVLKKIDALNPSDISDQSIIKFLTLTKLISEIQEK
jgi:hypothetical protein